MVLEHDEQEINGKVVDLKGDPNSGLTGATVGFFIGFAAVALFGPSATRFEAAMGLSGALTGLLVATPNLSGSLLRIPFAAWSDQVGARKPLLLLLYLSIIGMLGLTGIVFLLYPNNLTIAYYPVILLLGLLSGCGIATFSVGISQVSYWFSKNKQGKALGIYAGVGNLAPGIFSFIVPIALFQWELAGSYFFWLVLLVIGTIIYFIIGRNAYSFQAEEQGVSPEKAKEMASKKGQEMFSSGNLKESLMSSAKTWQTWVLVGLYFTSFGGFIALAPWLPKYWEAFFSLGAYEVFGVSMGIAGSLAGTFVIIGSLVRVYSGNLADKITGEKTVFLGIATLLAGSLLMMTSFNLAISLLAMVAMAVGMGIMNAGVFKLVPKYVSHAVGGAAGWVGGLGAFGGFVVPPILGVFVDVIGSDGYAYGFVVFTLLSLISMGLVGVLIKADQNRTEKYGTATPA